MKLVDLPQEVLDDLSYEDRWRLDIDPGFDSKHEFWMAWRHFLVLPEPTASSSPATEEELAEFLTVQGFDILLPVPRSHHPFIRCLRLIPSVDTKPLTPYHQAWFRDAWAARYGFLAVTDRTNKAFCVAVPPVAHAQQRAGVASRCRNMFAQHNMMLGRASSLRRER